MSATISGELSPNNHAGSQARIGAISMTAAQTASARQNQCRLLVAAQMATRHWNAIMPSATDSRSWNSGSVNWRQREDIMDLLALPVMVAGRVLIIAPCDARF